VVGNRQRNTVTGNWPACRVARNIDGARRRMLPLFGNGGVVDDPPSIDPSFSIAAVPSRATLASTSSSDPCRRHRQSAATTDAAPTSSPELFSLPIGSTLLRRLEASARCSSRAARPVRSTCPIAPASPATYSANRQFRYLRPAYIHLALHVPNLESPQILDLSLATRPSDSVGLTHPQTTTIFNAALPASLRSAGLPRRKSAHSYVKSIFAMLQCGSTSRIYIGAPHSSTNDVGRLGVI